MAKIAMPFAASLFPILQTAVVLPLTGAEYDSRHTGIARLASESSHAGNGHDVEFRSLDVRSILNKSYSRRSHTFARSINPYRGCEFACRYCYARYTHEFMALRDPADFERKIFIKQNAAWLLEQELRKLPNLGSPGSGLTDEIAIGTATDPYQPIERRARVTESLLKVFAERSGLRIGIVTKSTLIERDIPLLQRIAARNELTLHLTITTPKAALARILEPRAPRPDLRFRTVLRLRQAGLQTGILCSPLLPGITDTLRALDAMAARARAADASFFAAEPLFLKPCSKETYMAFIRQYFPKLEAMYRERFDGAAFVSTAYRDRTQIMVRAVCKKHGLARRSTDALLTRDIGLPQCQPQEPAQSSLFPLAEISPARRQPAKSMPLGRAVAAG